MKRKIIGIFVCVLIIATAFPIMGLAENNEIKANSNEINEEIESFTVTLKSEPYEITISADGKSEIMMEGYGSILVPGCPKIPSKTFFIGIPPNGEIVSVELVDEHHEIIPGSYDILPAPPFSNGIDKVSYRKNEGVYSSSDSYPTNVYEYLGMGQLRKYSFARIRFNPISYIPATGELTLFTDLTLKIEYKITDEISNELLSDTAMDDIASDIIVNYRSIRSSYIPSSSSAPLETYDYIIITTSSLENSVKFLKNWRETTGHSANVVTTSWISSAYSGTDLPEKIRNFLMDKYLDWGIEYVLIVGSDSRIPMRDCYPDKDNHGSSGKTPTDYYYADLTGDWDRDGDGFHGERSDDSPDFNAEVWVGRIPVDDPEIVENICQKIIDFEQDSGTWKKNVLLLGAISNYAKEDHNSNYKKTDGAKLMEELWNDVYNPNAYSRTTMYEKEGLNPSSYSCNYPLTNGNVLSNWPNGYGIVNWKAHGGATSASRKWWAYDDGDGIPEKEEMSWSNFIKYSDKTFLNNEKPSIVFSCSCNNAYPENSNNLGKSLLENGSVAFVGSTRVSWYTVGWSDESDGGNAAIDYYFFKYLINSDQTCGEALYNSKSHYLKEFNWWGWKIYQNMYDFCLYGDPATSLKTVTNFSSPDKPNKPYGTESGAVQVEYNYSTNATDPDNHQLYYLWDWGDGNFSEWLGPYDSGETCETSFTWEIKGSYEIKVKVKDIIGAESEWSDPLSVSMPKYKTINPNSLFQWFLELHPCMFPLLRQLLGL